MSVPPDGHDGHEVREFTASDGAVLKYRRWSPMAGSSSSDPRGLIVALHGIQSHSGWYGWSSSRLSAAGYDVRFLDRRGSGLNDQNRGHAESATRLMDDVIEFTTATAAERRATPGDVPVFLSAVSWGAKLAASVAASQQGLIDGLLLLYPAIFTQLSPNVGQRAAIQALTRCGLGRLRVSVPLDDPTLFTDVPQWQKFIRTDPLALHRVTMSFLQATLDLTQQAESAPQSIGCPTLIMLAGQDEIVDTPRTRQWGDRLADEQRTVIEYPETRHTLEFDSKRERFVADLIEWIELIRESCDVCPEAL